jgi:Flagellar biosynthesis pathway, component FliR
MDDILAFLLATMVASLRLGPTLAFAPPFTLIKIPATVRVITAVGLAACIPGLATTAQPSVGLEDVMQVAVSELAVGLAMALALQLAFALIGLAGRAIDIQAGFGLAYLIDPTTRAQTPLIGAVFTYGASAAFVASGGLYDVLAAFSASFDRIPLGTGGAPDSIGPIARYIGTLTILALGLAGLVILVLFLIDLVVAMLSRTLPQMNVLVLGFQVKVIATLVLLPITLGTAAASILRILRLATEAMVYF